MRCKIHKRYKGKLRPRCSCLDCWIMYIESHPDLGTIEDGIEHQRNFHGGGDIEHGNTDDWVVTSYLLKRKQELQGVDAE